MSELFKNVGRMTLMGGIPKYFGEKRVPVRFCSPQIPHGLAGTVRTITPSDGPNKLCFQRFGTAVPSSGMRVQFAYCITLARWCYKIHWLNLWLRQIKLNVTWNEQNQMLQNICNFSGMRFYRA